MQKKSLFTIIGLVFIFGIVGTSIISSAHATTIDPLSSIVRLLRELLATEKNKQTEIPLTVAGSNTGNFSIPMASVGQILYYGNTLCGIKTHELNVLYDTIMIQFASTTLVQNQNPSCTGFGVAFGFSNGTGNIILKNHADFTFHKGDKLILNRATNTSWFMNNGATLIEIAREIS